MHPELVERIIESHPEVVAVRAYAMPHPQFGHVLAARVELTNASKLTTEGLAQWLKTKLSRAEMPHKIEFAPLNVLSTGKRISP